MHAYPFLSLFQCSQISYKTLPVGTAVQKGADGYGQYLPGREQLFIFGRMTFQECVAHCDSHKHLIGKPIADGLVIAHLVPAPTSSSEPDKYFKALRKSSFDYHKIPPKILKLAFDYEPYILIDNPADSWGGLLGWYSQWFQEGKSIME